MLSMEDKLKKPGRKSALLFSCKNAALVMTVFVCDGDNDCTDGSDEQDCPKMIKTLNKSKTECGSLYYKEHKGKCQKYYVTQEDNNKLEENQTNFKCLSGKNISNTCLQSRYSLRNCSLTRF